MPPYRRYSVTMEILLFPFLFARKFSHALQAWALVLPLCRGKEENGFWVVCTFDFLSVASGCCFPFAFLLENNLRKLCTPPKYFQKLIFSIKTLEIGKCLQLRQNTLVLNTRPIVLLKFRWIFNLKGLSPRHWPLSCDAAFPYSALLVGGGRHGRSESLASRTFVPLCLPTATLHCVAPVFRLIKRIRNPG